MIDPGFIGKVYLRFNMKVNAKGVVILNAVKDLEGTHGKILHYVQNDTTSLSSFFVPACWHGS